MVKLGNQLAAFFIGLLLGILTGLIAHAFSCHQDWYYNTPMYKLEETIIPSKPCSA